MPKLWAGRFSKDVIKSVLDYTQTVDIDSKLIIIDIWGSIAHIIMLCKQQIVPEKDGIAILNCLLSMLDEAKNSDLILDVDLEDVHLNIEALLIDELGIDVGGKLHTARSRNDQVITDTRIYVRESIIRIQKELLFLIRSLLNLSTFHLESVIPGYTHSQPAQPITISYWLTAYSSMLLRDLERLSDAYSRVNKSPLGACALAGTSFNIDRGLTARLLGFEETLLHSLDATSSRDFIIETLSCLSILMSNLSKLAEEIVWWNSFEFGLIQVDDSFSTGSSIMPQKKNPVVAELVRGRTGKVYGSLMQILTVVKSVASGYSCDLQEDKPFLWQSIDTVFTTLSIVREQIETIEFNRERGKELCWKNFSTATELANYLVSINGVSFRKSHEIIGEIVGSLISSGKDLSNFDYIKQLLLDYEIDIDIKKLEEILDPSQSIHKQTSEGGTSPKSVSFMVNKLTENATKQEALIRVRSDNSEESFKKSLVHARYFIKNGRFQDSP